jgi:hypothetical protein
MSGLVALLLPPGWQEFNLTLEYTKSAAVFGMELSRRLVNFNFG